MKNTIKLLGALLVAATTVTSCVDDSLLPYDAPAKPGSLEDYEYLKAYDVMKSYLNRETHPNFKLSAAVEAGDFKSGSAVTRIVSTNFDEVVAGNAFKMASVVNEKGEFNYGTVQEFVSNAENNGLTVYGHTLAWHSQQPVKWLNKLIADKPKPVDPNGEKNKYLVCSGEAKENSWDKQARYNLPVSMEAGKTYTLTLKVKGATSDGVVALWPIWNASDNKDQWGGSSDLQYLAENPVTKEWTTIKWTWEATFPEDCLQLVFGKFDGDICFDDVVLTVDGGSENMVACSDFEDGQMDGWSNNWGGPTLSVKEETSAASSVEYKDVWTNELPDYASFNVGDEVSNFVIRDANNNDAPAVLVSEGGVTAVKVVGKTETTYSWDTQFFVYTPNKKWEAGEKYRFHIKYKATASIGTDTQVHAAPGEYKHWQMLNPNPSFTTEWKEQTWEGSIPSEGAGTQQSIAFNLNKNRTADEGTAETVGSITYYFADFSWESCKQVEVPKTEEVEIKKRVIIVETDDMKDAAWDSQFWIQTNEPFHAGDKYEFKAEVRAAKAASPGTQIHKGSAGGYIHWAAIGNTSFSTDWETVTATGTIPAEGDGGDFIAWNLNDFADANTYMFGSISFKINGVEMLNNTDLKGSDNSSFWKKEKRGATVNAPIADGYTEINEIKSTIPLTEEEKRDTLIYAMQKWIYGMMEATEGKVKSWDLINEAVSGGGNVNGNYDLQHFKGYETGTWDVGGDAFYWQDYLGAENYGVIVDSIARNAYAQQEGANPADLKLFVNDYNLESTWDDNKKLESLIYWIGVWERGGAKIDGIGTQMHLTYYLDQASQNNQKEHITKMFKRMAETGKLVRVSELDMGVKERPGSDEQVPPITVSELAKRQDGLAIEKAMADYYQWIVEEYFRCVPAPQQYGICQWCLTDSPKNSGWRADQPVGLWYQDYTRKPAYAGWAEGLKNAK